MTVTTEFGESTTPVNVAQPNRNISMRCSVRFGQNGV